MDPVSLVTACVGTLAGIAQLSAQISSLTSGFADAKRDLERVLQELASIGVCLETLREAPFKDDLPPSLLQKLIAVVRNCDAVCSEIADLLQKLASGSVLQRLSWTFKQRERVDRLRLSLEAHKSALDIALELGAITQLHELQGGTKSIKHDTVALRASVALVEQMADQIQAISLHVRQGQDVSNDAVVDAFLADVAVYAKETPPSSTERGPSELEDATHEEIWRLRAVIDVLRGEQRDLQEDRDWIQKLHTDRDEYVAQLQRHLRWTVEQGKRQLGDTRAFIDRQAFQLKLSVGTIALAMTTDPQSELGIRRICMLEYEQLHHGMARDFEELMMSLAQVTDLRLLLNPHTDKENEDIIARSTVYAGDAEGDIGYPGIWGSEPESGHGGAPNVPSRCSSAHNEKHLLRLPASCMDRDPIIPYSSLHGKEAGTGYNENSP